MSSLDKLPVELIDRIFDYLDGKTILLSVREVSKRFYNMTNNYQRYRMDFRSISMKDFHILCKKIDPNNIRKLILFNDEKTIGLIERFLTKFHFEEFVNIDDLILSHIEDQQYEITLKQLENHQINNLSLIKFDLYNNKEYKYRLLSNVLTRQSLEKVDLEFRLADIKDFPWPMNCSIKSLRIGNIITLNQFSRILSQTPYLQKLILKDCSNKDSLPIPMKLFEQLNSITLELTRMNLDELQYLLRWIPSINYLKIIGTNQLANGNSWEKFVNQSLRLLKNFQFYFDGWDNTTEEQYQTIIKTYQSNFWLEDKQWFINCELFCFNRRNHIRLYSLPLFYHIYQLDANIQNTSFTTSPHFYSKDSVTQLVMDFTLPIQSSDHHRNIPRFDHVTELKLILNESWTEDCFKLLTSLVNLSNLQTLTINTEESSRLSDQLTKNLTELLKKTINVETFSLTSGQSPLTNRITLEQIFAIVPQHVKHLQVMVKDFDEIEKILDQLDHLSSIIFQIVRVMARGFSDGRSQITEKRKGSTCQKMDPFLNMWLGKSNTNIDKDNQ